MWRGMASASAMAYENIGENGINNGVCREKAAIRNGSSKAAWRSKK